MTGPEHYREAERWLVHARDTYMDDSSDPGRREDYATEADYLAAVTEANEAHEQSIRETAVFAALGQAHATLAQAAATAEAGGLAKWGDLSDLPATPWAHVLSAGQQQDGGVER